MEERRNSAGEVLLLDKRTRYYRNHLYAGQPLLRRVVAWMVYSGLEKPFASREPSQVKKVA